MGAPLSIRMDAEARSAAADLATARQAYYDTVGVRQAVTTSSAVRDLVVAWARGEIDWPGAQRRDAA